MARYVLVEFDDDAAARKFVEKVNGNYGLPEGERKFRVRAVWGKPTKFCDCIGARKGLMGFRRGEKSGWWLHTECGRPTRQWAKGNHWFSAIGRNLLPGNKDYTPGSTWGYL